MPLPVPITLCSEELAGRVAELEEQVKAAEGLAFEFEARAAALELEVFRKMDEEHAQSMREVGELNACPMSKLLFSYIPEPCHRHKPLQRLWLVAPNLLPSIR